MTKIIGIAGLAGAGKDSIARHLIEHFGYEKEAFARRLKELCARLYGWDVARLDDLTYKETESGHSPELVLSFEDVRVIAQSELKRSIDDTIVAHLYGVFSQIETSWTRRKILQYVGTEGFRAIDPNHWIKRGLTDAAERERVVFTDVRFENEARAIRETGGVILGVQKLDGSVAGARDFHVSELDVFKVIAGADLCIGIKKGRMDLVEWFALAYGQFQESR
jgi:hypothetical protein